MPIDSRFILLASRTWSIGFLKFFYFILKFMETLSKTPYLGRHGRHSESLIQDRLQSIKNLEQAQWNSLRNKRDRGELAYKPTFYGKILTLLYTIAVFGLGVVVGLLISFFF